MIRIRQRIVPGSRTHTGSLWEAMTEIGGKTYSATSRHGAPQALARVLVAAGIADQPVEVRSEVCVLDAGKEMRTEELRGCITYRSLHAMAKWTFTEGAATPLHRVRFQEQPEGVFSIEASGQEMRFTPPDDLVVAPVSDPSKKGRRRCVSCDVDFFPARPWSRFCSSACRLRAHRRLRHQDQNVPPIVEAPRASSGQEAWPSSASPLTDPALTGTFHTT
jgi:hypothetical protein